jgi:oxygen-independent coproporphyrinogen-3 oxidase
MLGLRMREGVDIEAAAAELGADPYPGGRRGALERLAERRRIVRRGARITVPREAWIWADDTAASLF